MRYLAAMLLLCLPTAAGQVRPLPDVPGTWEVSIEPASNTKWAACSEPDHRIFLSKIQAIAALLHTAKVFNPPRGFKGQGNITCSEANYFEPCANLPLGGRLWIMFLYFADNGDGTPHTDGEVHEDADFYFNPYADNSAEPKGHGITSLPVAWGQLGGVTLYGGQYSRKNQGNKEAFIFLAKRSRPLWIPVSREQYLGYMIQDEEAERAKQEADFARQAEESKKQPPCDQDYKNWMADREKRLKDHEETYQYLLKKTTPADAEQFRTNMEKAEADTPAVFKTTIATCEKLRKQVAQRAAEPVAPDPLLERLRAALAAMTPAERASQAWTEKFFAYDSFLAPANTGDAMAVVKFNPDYYDFSRPRTDIQLIEVHLTHVPGNLVEPPLTDWGSLGLLRLWQFENQVDWQRLQGMISE